MIMGHMQQIRHNYKRCQHHRQNIAIGTEEKKKWTEEETDIESWTLAQEDAYTNTLTMNKDTNDTSTETHQYI